MYVCFTFTSHTRMAAIPISEVRVIRSPCKVEHTIILKDNATFIKVWLQLTCLSIVKGFTE